MTRKERLQYLKEEKRQKTILITILISLIFATAYSATYAYIVVKENERIKDKINSYNSDIKIYYLKKDIERGDY